MINDLRFAFRQLWKSPSFTIAAVAVLALGIGVNTAIFSLVDVMVFQPPAYQQPAEIAQLFSQDKKDPKNFRTFSYPTYCDIRDQNSVFSGLLAHDDSVVGIGEKGNFRRAVVDIVSSNYFSVLGVLPAYGRSFRPEEEKPGANERVAVVSYSYWQKQARDPSLLGRELLINGRPYTIVGIMPKGFTGTESVFSREAWLPLGVYDEIISDRGGSRNRSLNDRGSDRLMVIGRLKPGVTAEAAQPALKGLAANLEAAFPVEQKDQTLMTAPLNKFATSTSPVEDDPIPTIGGLLAAMAAVVLLVACLNLANMLLARGTSRRKEIAIRLALGGSRGRIVRQLLTEGFLLALLGGICGLILGLWSSDLLVASLSKILPMDVVWLSGPNPTILGATLGFCVLGTICFALGPALKLSRSAVIEDLKQQAGEDAHRPRWKFLPRNPLVVVQIAFSLALVTAAGLFIRGAGKAAAVETGLHAETAFLVEIDASLGGVERKRAQDLYRIVGEKFAALPGVQHAGISATVPFGISSVQRSVLRAGLRPAPDAKPATPAEGQSFSPSWNSVGADYFAAVGLPLLRGRAFTAAEATQPGGPAIAVIDELLAKKLWPEGDALGQHIQFPVRESAPPETADDGSGEIKRGEAIEIIGIVPATRNRLFERRRDGAVYLPFSRGFQSDVFFFVKFASLSPGSESATADLLRRTVQSVDPLLAILELRSFEKHLDGNPQLWIVRAGAALFSIFGGLALGLAVIGVYGVKAYSVASAHARDRDPDGPRREGENGAMDDFARRFRDGRRWSGPGTSLRFWHGKNCQQHSLPGQLDRSVRLYHRPGRADDRCSAGDVAAGAARHKDQPNGGVANRMKKRTSLLSLLTLCSFASFLTAAGPGPGMRDEIEKSFQVRPGGVLLFDADIGNVEIFTGNSDKVRVEYTLEFKVKTAEEATALQQKLTIEMGQTDGTTAATDENKVKVVVRFAADRQDRDRNKVRLDFRITMPRKFNLDLRTVGSGKVEDLDGTAKASILGGSLKLGNVRGAVKATTKGGSLAIGDVGGDLEARASGGSVKAGRVHGKALAVAEGGTVTIEETGELLEATAHGGSVKASLSKPPRAACKITANAGSIDLQLPASAAVTVDASCTAGVVMSEFAVAGDGGDRAIRLKGDINGGGPALVLRATAGSIHLRKGGQ